MIAGFLVSFYKFWHGALGLPGAGIVISLFTPMVSGLRSYSLRLPEGHTVELDFRDVSAIYWLNHTLGDPFEEAGLLAAILTHLEPEGNFWDIGANCGLLSYRIAKSVQAGETHAFEPNPKMFKLAKRVLLPFEKCSAHNFGISSSNDKFVLTVPDGHTTMGTLEPDATSRHGTAVEIVCRKGDDLITEDGMRPPTVIKIDTEGHELKVLLGLANIISEFRPVVFFEHISLSEGEVADLVPASYTLHTVEETTGELLPGQHRERGHNSVIVPNPIN